MEVILKPVMTYEVIAEDGTSLGTFSRTSEWEGMTKIVRDGESIIILSEEVLFSFFNRAEEARTAVVVMASPDLTRQLKLPKVEVDKE